MDTPDNTQTESESLAVTWLRQQPIAGKLAAMELLYLALVHQTQDLGRQIHRAFLQEIEDVARDETAAVTLEERTIIGHTLALRDVLVGQEGRETHPPSATTRREGGSHGE